MKFTAVASKAILVVLLATAVCVSAADNPHSNRKRLRSGFRLCVYKGSQQAHQQRMCNVVRQRRFTTRDPRGGWNHLLADRRHHAIEWTELEASTLRRRKSNGKRQGI